MASVPDTGRLDAYPLPQLLLGLQRRGFTGALELSRERVRKRILLREGLPVFAESNLASESLGIQLMDRGVLARGDYNRVAAHIERTGCKEGVALLQLGLLEPRALFLALKEQLRSRILECFSWPTGEFALDTSEKPAEDAQPFRTDVTALLQEGLETHWSSDRMLETLGPQMQRYPSASPRFDAVSRRLRRDAAVEALLGACDGERTLWQVVQLARTPRALAAVWVLDAAGAWRYRSEPASGRAGPGAEYEVELVVQAPSGGARPPAAPEAPRAPAAPRRAQPGRAEALAREIEERHASLGEADAYTLLGIERGADAAAIRGAYHRAAKAYHPDALAQLGLSAEVRAQASRLFAEIGKAQAVLADPRRRSEHDASLGRSAADLDANRLAQAETLYRKAEVLMRQGNFRGALDFLQPCVELWPDECSYQAALGWALYKKSPSEPEPARERLEAATRIDPDDGKALFYLSVVLRALGDTGAADDAAARAHRLDAGA